MFPFSENYVPHNVINKLTPTSQQKSTKMTLGNLYITQKVKISRSEEFYFGGSYAKLVALS